ncbi:transcriptional Coactivator p15-domain-containing protein [Triangularia verruculosa]|uniref:Transcriptional Coactivator p15-domain-containing protein n=1 Tax=Triangularia verruculosa TaxID=2587418 RepID=A0AAN6XL79_9PEZI|nr:transcriptional Coactivator p15-domain-containing protein [Triangularia verruculosa]
MSSFRKRGRVQIESDEEDTPRTTAPAKKQKQKQERPKAALSGGKGTDGEGNAYWELGNNRRVGASKFKNATLVNLREYYTAPDGELRPGKKGISLSIDQYKAFLKAIPQLNEELRSQGVGVDDVPAGTGGSSRKSAQKAESNKSKKANIEVTSEEEEDEEDDEDDE